MNRRLQLHNKLVQILGSPHVYYQPPPTIKMSYPAIVYKRHNITKKMADNSVYDYVDCYQVTLITKDPDDSTVYDILNGFKNCSFDTHYLADNLNHESIILYY